MASFTVDAIGAAKQKEMERVDLDASVAQLGRQMQRTAVKASETNQKRVMQERERQLKMEEQRVARILLMKIERRFQAFPFLKEKIPPVSGKPSIPELQETDELQKLELNLQGAEKRLRAYISRGSMVLESVWGDGRKMTFLPEHLRLNLSGFGSLINSPTFQEEAEPLITETVIEYPEFGQLNLPLRWAQCILQAMVTVHQLNTNPEFRALMQKKVIAETELEESGDEEEEEEKH